MFEMLKANPFPALFEDMGNGYPKSEMGYIRAYFRDGRWWNTCFNVGEFKYTLASEFDDIYGMFIESYPTLGKMRDMCAEKATRIEDWCNYAQYESFMETPIGLYRFVMRFTPGDYNLYMHCYDKFEIPWSDPERIRARIRENIECGEEDPFNFKISKEMNRNDF